MRTIRRYLPAGARLFLGLVFTVFGLNYFFHFLSMPPPTGRAATVLGALSSTGFVLPIAHATEIAGGLLLLANLFVPLALTALAPVVVNIVAFHLLFAPEGMPVPLAILAAGLYVAWTQRSAFRPMLRSRASDSPQAGQPAPKDATGLGRKAA